MILSVLCGAWRYTREKLVAEIERGRISDDAVAGALMAVVNPQASIKGMFQVQPTTPMMRTVDLRNGMKRQVQGASNADQLAMLGGVGVNPADFEELIRLTGTGEELL